MVPCQICGAEVPETAVHCVQCGSPMHPEVASPTGPPKRTMMGIAGVDQAEIQKAIEAARAAAAAGGKPATPDAAKKGGRRTMLGLVAPPVVTPRAADPTPEDEGWDAPVVAPMSPAVAPPVAAPIATKRAPKSDTLDDDWGVSDGVVPLVAKVAPRVPVAQAPAGPSADPTGSAALKGTVLLGSMAQAPSPAASTSPAPTAAPAGAAGAAGGPKGTVMLGSMAQAPVPAEAPRTTAEFGTAPRDAGAGAKVSPVVASDTAPSSGALAGRGTMLLGSAPQGPATAPPARPITGSRRAPEPAPTEDDATRDTEPPPPTAAMQATPQVPTRAAEPLPFTGVDIPGSSADPLADTIAPGSLSIDDLASPAHPPTSTQRAEIPKTTVQPQSPASGARFAVSPSQSSSSVKKAATTTSPPFLASKALQEDMAPTEPGRGWMRGLAIGLGAALAGLWAAPVSLRPLGFAWTAALELEGPARALAFYTPAAGVLLVLLGLLPVPYLVRAAFVCALGATPVLAGATGLGPLSVERGWPGLLIGLAMVILPGALIHRDHYRASILSRVVVALGILLVLCWALVPGGSHVVSRIVEGLAAGPLGIATSVWYVGIFVLCALSLLAFMSSASTGGCGIVGRVMLLFRPGVVLLATVAASRSSDGRIGLAVATATLFAFGTLASYGLAQLFAWISTPRARSG